MALLSAAIGAIPNASAAIIADTFTTGTTSRAVGDPLAGTTTTIGGATWVLGSTVGTGPKFTALNEVDNGGESTLVSVSLASLGSLSNKIVTVAADVNFSGNAWGSVQFAQAADSTINVFASSLTLYFQQNNGNWVIFTNAFGVVASGSVGIPPAGLSTIKLGIDTTSNQAAAWINGANVAPYFDLTYTPALNYAGFGAYDVTNKDAWLTRIDNFRVEVPQPATFLLLGLCAMVMLVRRRGISPYLRWGSSLRRVSLQPHTIRKVGENRTRTSQEKN